MAGKLQGLRTLIYPVDDLDAAKSWWSSFLGAEPYFYEVFYVGFNIGGYELGLLPGQDPSEGAYVYWGVEDVEAAVASAIAQGASVHSPPTDVGEGIVTALVRNPQAALVGFIFNPNFVLEAH